MIDSREMPSSTSVHSDCDLDERVYLAIGVNERTVLPHVSYSSYWSWVTYLLLSSLVLLVFARWLPYDGLVSVLSDSSMFLYIGQQMNEGLGHMLTYRTTSRR